MAFLTSENKTCPWTHRGAASPMRRLTASALLVLAFIGPSMMTAREAPSKEYQVKAVFLLNFLHFAEWPESAFANAGGPIRIAVVGEDPFAGALAAAVQDEKVGQRSIVVEHYSRVQDVMDCHVVFVCKSESAHVPAIVSAFAGKPVLTVGDMPDFARRGGIINFYLEGQKVRFEVNRAAAHRSGFKLSSQLLALARIVGPPV